MFEGNTPGKNNRALIDTHHGRYNRVPDWKKHMIAGNRLFPLS
jgi:hypothetical protein